jgi:uncharacterized membrane protein YfcA
MWLYILGFTTTIVFKSFMSMGGIGAAFILVPIFYWMGMPFPQAAAIGLMLGVLSTGTASLSYIKDKLINFRVAIPVILAIFIFSPIGVYSSNIVNKNILLAIFAAFLIVAGSMMIFYHPNKKSVQEKLKTKSGAGFGVGGIIGFLSGLLGVGGGSFLGPFLVWLGMDGKEVAGTSSFVVMFSSLVGFLGHVGFQYSSINYSFLAVTAVASIIGGLLGSWFTRFKLSGKQVKQIIGVFQYLIAAKLIFDLLI